jgi:hypothetical protein
MKVRLGFLFAISIFNFIGSTGVNFKNETLYWYSFFLILACTLIMMFREGDK